MDDKLYDLVPVLHTRNAALLQENQALSEKDNIQALVEAFPRLMHECDHINDATFVGEVMSTLRSFVQQNLSSEATDPERCAESLLASAAFYDLKTKICSKVASSMELLVDEERLENTRHTRKKKKSGEYTVFNFDDLGEFAEYEPLENTLLHLRDSATAAYGFEKLTKMDINDLLDHPQWSELMTLLCNALQHREHEEQVLLIYTRFIVLMHGYQAGNVISDFLRFMKSTCPTAAPNLSIMTQTCLLTFSETLRSRLQVFGLCLRKIPNLCGGVTDAEFAEILVLLFQLLVSRNVSIDDNISISLFEAMSFVREFGHCVQILMRSAPQTQITMIILQTGFLSFLYRLLDDASCDYCNSTVVVAIELLFSSLLPYKHNTSVINYLLDDKDFRDVGENLILSAICNKKLYVINGEAADKCIAAFVMREHSGYSAQFDKLATKVWNMMKSSYDGNFNVLCVVVEHIAYLPDAIFTTMCNELCNIFPALLGTQTDEIAGKILLAFESCHCRRSVVSADAFANMLVAMLEKVTRASKFVSHVSRLLVVSFPFMSSACMIKLACISVKLCITENYVDGIVSCLSALPIYFQSRLDADAKLSLFDVICKSKLSRCELNYSLLLMSLTRVLLSSFSTIRQLIAQFLSTTQLTLNQFPEECSDIVIDVLGYLIAAGYVDQLTPLQDSLIRTYRSKHVSDDYNSSTTGILYLCGRCSLNRVCCVQPHIETEYDSCDVYALRPRGTTIHGSDVPNFSTDLAYYVLDNRLFDRFKALVLSCNNDSKFVQISKSSDTDITTFYFIDKVIALLGEEHVNVDKDRLNECIKGCAGVWRESVLDMAPLLAVSYAGAMAYAGIVSVHAIHMLPKQIDELFDDIALIVSRVLTSDIYIRKVRKVALCATSISIESMTAIILRNWFFHWLPFRDICAITALTFADGSHHAAVVTAAIIVTALDLLPLSEEAAGLNCAIQFIDNNYDFTLQKLAPSINSMYDSQCRP